MKVRAAFLALLAAGLFAGCDWSPPRDNPRDPFAPNYDPPETITWLSIETHCRWERGDICYMTLIAIVNDPEGISSLDSAQVYLGDTLLGQMDWEPTHEWFTFNADANSEVLPHNMHEYETRYFIVRFKDDAGNLAKDSVRLTRVIDSWYNDYPRLSWPAGNDTIVLTDTFSFVWYRYGAPFDFTYRLDCYECSELPFWNTYEIPKQDTTIRVEIPFPDACYFWILSIEDGVGNTAESERQRFWVFDTTDSVQ